MDIDTNKFFSNVEEPDENGCMLWKLSLRSSGYGSFYLSRSAGKRRRLNPHRVAFYINNNRWPKKDCYIVHTCGNRHCVSIEHLQEVHKDYKRREMIEKGKKKCNNCGETKPLDGFNKKNNSFSHRCTICVRAYDKIWYQNNKEKQKHWSMEYKKNNFFKQYGGTSEDYNNILYKQNNTCAICKSDEKLVVDHCHLCGFRKLEAVRGLLCHKCNTQSSFSLDTPYNILTKALEYGKIHYDKYHKI